MIFDRGLLRSYWRFVSSGLRWQLSWELWLKHQSPVQFAMRSGTFKSDTRPLWTFAWHSCVNSFFKLPGKCVTLWSIGIWQRLLDFYFVNGHFNILCIFTEKKNLFCSINYFASKEWLNIFSNKKWPSMKHCNNLLEQLNFFYVKYLFIIIIIDIFIEVCFKSFSPMTINMIFLSWELQFGPFIFFIWKSRLFIWSNIHTFSILYWFCWVHREWCVEGNKLHF